MNHIDTLMKIASYKRSYEEPQWTANIAVQNAYPDLKKICEWIKNQPHLVDCDIYYFQTKDKPCSCGLSDIQSLLGE